MAKIAIGNGELEIGARQAKSILPGTRIRLKSSELSVSRFVTVKDVLIEGPFNWPFEFVLVDGDDYEILVSAMAEIKIIKILPT